MPINLDGILGRERLARWHALGLRKNPFPASGLTSEVEYDRPSVSESVNSWLAEVVNSSTTSFRPLVVFGDVGVGKTHILHRVQRVVSEYSAYSRRNGGAGWGVQLVALPEMSQGRLELSRLLLTVIQGTNGIGLSPSLPVPIVGAIATGLLAKHDPYEGLNVLPSGSHLAAAMRQVIAADGLTRSKILDIIGRWLLRNTPTPPQRSLAALSGALTGEGDAIQAYTDVVRLAHATGLIQGQLFLLDQIEDLWRRQAVTAMRRARFLTDLRSLIDQCLTGAPIAVVLAWNTNPAGDSRPTNSLLETDYVALWTRLKTRVEITPLHVHEIRPFAEAYIRHEEQLYIAERVGAGPTTASLLARLTAEVIETISLAAAQAQPTGRGRVVQRHVLDALRDWANSEVMA